MGTYKKQYYCYLTSHEYLCIAIWVYTRETAAVIWVHINIFVLLFRHTQDTVLLLFDFTWISFYCWLGTYEKQYCCYLSSHEYLSIPVSVFGQIRGTLLLFLISHEYLLIAIWAHRRDSIAVIWVCMNIFVLLFGYIWETVLLLFQFTWISLYWYLVIYKKRYCFCLTSHEYLCITIWVHTRNSITVIWLHMNIFVLLFRHIQETVLLLSDFTWISLYSYLGTYKKEYYCYLTSHEYLCNAIWVHARDSTSVIWVHMNMFVLLFGHIIMRDSIAVTWVRMNIFLLLFGHIWMTVVLLYEVTWISLYCFYGTYKRQYCFYFTSHKYIHIAISAHRRDSFAVIWVHRNIFVLLFGHWQETVLLLLEFTWTCLFCYLGTYERQYCCYLTSY